MKQPLRAALLALAFVLSACATKGTTSTGTPPTPSPVLTVEQVVQQISASPSGQAILAWVNGLAPNAQAALKAFNSKIGLSVAQVQTLCGWDNTAHSLVQLALVVDPALPSGVVTGDNIGYAAIQDTCALATSGTLPSGSQIQALVAMANDLAGITTPAAKAALPAAPPAARSSGSFVIPRPY